MLGVLLRIAMILAVGWFFVPRRVFCPHCREETLPLVTSTLLMKMRVQRRWCACGWEGLSRAMRSRRPSGPRSGTPIRPPVVVALLALALACAPPDDPVARLFSDPSRWVDLTYPFNAETVYWPTAEPFAFDTVASGISEGGYYYAAFNFAGAEHGGTHLDAPIHFAEARQTTDRIPLGRLIGPAFVVNVAQQVGDNADYLISTSDLQRFEEEHGRIPDGAILLFHTGWGARWPDRARYLGTDQSGPEAVPLLHFPGLDPEAARWLVSDRSVDAVGIDTPSIDYGQSQSFEAHRILYEENVPGFENVANLDDLPETGAYVVALPMLIEGGSGGPLRIVGVIP